MSRDLFPRRLIFGRHGSTWPGDDHATSRGFSTRFPLAAHPPQPTSPWSARDHATRLNAPPSADASMVPAVILPPRGFSCCCKLLPKTMLPSEDFRLLHCPRLCSRRRTILVVVSPVAVPLPKTGPDGAHDYIRTGTAPSASASASQAGPRCAQRWRERVVRCFQIWMP